MLLISHFTGALLKRAGDLLCCGASNVCAAQPVLLDDIKYFINLTNL